MANYDKELDITRNILEGRGFIGKIAKLLFGKKIMSGFAASFNQVESQHAYHEKQQELKGYGTPAAAEVLSINDTDMLVNYNPVAEVTLRVMTDDGYEFTETIKTTLRKVNAPRVGDIIKIKYNPNNTNEIVIVL